MGGFSVNRRLQSVIVTDDQAVKKRNLTIALDLLGRLNAGVLSVVTNRRFRLCVEL